MTSDEAPGRRRKRRPSGEEGALLTTLIVDEVKRLRAGLDWSAERLAEEMAAAGVPWTRDVVVNLENGRRKTLTVHELLALAWVLDVANPADLLVPQHGRDLMYPVTPATLLDRRSVAAWLKGETGPLRQWLAQPREGEPENLAELLEGIPPEMRKQVLILARSTARAPRVGGDGQG